jgi:hypothetical protein
VIGLKDQVARVGRVPQVIHLAVAGLRRWGPVEMAPRQARAGFREVRSHR